MSQFRRTWLPRYSADPSPASLFSGSTGSVPSKTPSGSASTGDRSPSRGSSTVPNQPADPGSRSPSGLYPSGPSRLAISPTTAAFASCRVSYSRSVGRSKTSPSHSVSFGAAVVSPYHAASSSRRTG